MAKGKKLSLDQAAKKLAAITEKHLSSLPEEEQDARVAAFERSVLTLQRDKTSRGRI